MQTAGQYAPASGMSVPTLVKARCVYFAKSGWQPPPNAAALAHPKVRAGGWTGLPAILQTFPPALDLLSTAI
ncbi:hypothetical protein D3C72_2221000 [compost metagenome]